MMASGVGGPASAIARRAEGPRAVGQHEAHQVLHRPDALVFPAGGGRALGHQGQRGALVAGDAGDADQVGGVACEGAEVQRREGFLLHPSGP